MAKAKRRQKRKTAVEKLGRYSVQVPPRTHALLRGLYAITGDSIGSLAAEAVNLLIRVRVQKGQPVPRTVDLKGGKTK